jgi:hypothetical protein
MTGGLLSLLGRQIRLVPKIARLGDTTCMLIRCVYPIVLRLRDLDGCNGRCFTLFGEAFIYGFMYGEEWARFHFILNIV